MIQAEKGKTLHKALQKGPGSFFSHSQLPLVHLMDRMETGPRPSRRLQDEVIHLPGQAELSYFQSKSYSEEEDADP